MISERNIEAIIHCGVVSGPMMAKGQPLLVVDVNVGGTAMLLDLARSHAMRRFVFCSSISVYGSALLITEDTPLRPTSVYAATKAACESLVGAFAAEYGLDGVCLRIGRVYGPYRRASCHLGSIIRDANAGRPTQIPADPQFAYHYVHVEDVAGAIGAALTLGLRGGGALLSLLVLPLYVPVLIFGAGAVDASSAGIGVQGHFSILGALLAVALFLAPLACAAALRISLE